jgi:hypothetical protein
MQGDGDRSAAHCSESKVGVRPKGQESVQGGVGDSEQSIAVSEPQYWLDIFTTGTWLEFLAHGSNVAAFSAYHERTVVDRVRPGDILLCYITGDSVFVGALEVNGPPFVSYERIYQSDVFPNRLPIRRLVDVPIMEGVSIKALASRFSFTAAGNARSWIGKVRKSLTRWAPEDAAIVLLGLRRRVASLAESETQVDPAFREGPVAEKMWDDLAKKFVTLTPDRLKAIEQSWDDTQAQPSALVEAAPPEAMPPSYEIEGSRVTVPDDKDGDAENDAVADEAAVSEHSEIQALLAQAGAKMGLQVWIATNDRARVVNGVALKDYPRVIDSLPTQFDDVAMRTVRLIDVLWIQKRSIVAAFEIESTTSVFSGLLRMNDMIAMVPNVEIPLFIVAPANRRKKVTSEINRPSFALKDTPMVEACRLITFEDLRSWYKRAEEFLGDMRASSLDSIAQYCEAG